jgi:hypothetical protein
MKRVPVVLLLTTTLVMGQELREEYRYNIDVAGKLETTLLSNPTPLFRHELGSLTPPGTVRLFAVVASEQSSKRIVTQHRLIGTHLDFLTREKCTYGLIVKFTVVPGSRENDCHPEGERGRYAGVLGYRVKFRVWGSFRKRRYEYLTCGIVWRKSLSEQFFLLSFTARNVHPRPQLLASESQSEVRDVSNGRTL